MFLVSEYPRKLCHRLIQIRLLWIVVLILIFTLLFTYLHFSILQESARLEDMPLRDMEQKRQKLLSEIRSYSKQIGELRKELSWQRTYLNRLKAAVERSQIETREDFCNMLSCFVHQKCLLTSGFPVYLYDPDKYPVGTRFSLKATLKQALGHNPHLTTDPKKACVFLVLVGQAPLRPNELKSLPYWYESGQNHVLLNLASGDVFSSTDTDKAILVQSTFSGSSFRPGFDLIASPALGPPRGDVWRECPRMVPARRRYLLSFQGELKLGESSNSNPYIVAYLKELARSNTPDRFLFEFTCVLASDDNANAESLDWVLCPTDTYRRAVLNDSTYVLIFPPPLPDSLSTTLLQTRVYEALRSGAIPVILGRNRVRLAYDEVIQWRRAAIFLPEERVTELHFLLRAIPDEDILLMRRQGRLIWERYLGSVRSTLDTILAVLRHRLHIPPLPAEPPPEQKKWADAALPVFRVKSRLYNNPAFRKNYSLALTQAHEMWNGWGDPFRLYPALPTHPFLRGNPREQFTVVLLTFEREQVLLASLARLRGVPFVSCVVVVWNSPKSPSPGLRWPDIGAPLHVVKARNNSLNNRFLPWDDLHTEAVLSVDDDANLTHAEILFAFRVWREHRERIVGFPGRGHAWNSTQNRWLYVPYDTCELSMVLTGAAFLHRHYLYLYWKLPQAIRDKVDEYMNCEDIAMNFLVSHITRLPPVKVASRQSFSCPECPKTAVHYEERHKCINFFSQVFGYTPLVNTHYSTVPILFDKDVKMKCF